MTRILVLFVFGLTLLAGCGGSGNENPGPPSSSSSTSSSSSSTSSSSSSTSSSSSSGTIPAPRPLLLSDTSFFELDTYQLNTNASPHSLSGKWLLLKDVEFTLSVDSFGDGKTSEIALLSRAIVNIVEDDSGGLWLVQPGENAVIFPIIYSESTNTFSTELLLGEQAVEFEATMINGSVISGNVFSREYPGHYVYNLEVERSEVTFVQLDTQPALDGIFSENTSSLGTLSFSHLYEVTGDIIYAEELRSVHLFEHYYARDTEKDLTGTISDDREIEFLFAYAINSNINAAIEAFDSSERNYLGGPVYFFAQVNDLLQEEIRYPNEILRDSQERFYLPEKPTLNLDLNSILLEIDAPNLAVNPEDPSEEGDHTFNIELNLTL